MKKAPSGISFPEPPRTLRTSVKILLDYFNHHRFLFSSARHNQTTLSAMARVKKKISPRTPKPKTIQCQTRLQNKPKRLRPVKIYRNSHENLLEFARTNLKDCLETHQRLCPTKISDLNGVLPTRLIDLRTISCPKLVLSNTIRSKDTLYTCLSHQWGKPDPNTRAIMTTVKDNLQSRLKGFDLENLPERYQEAMMTCHLLGVRYMDRFSVYHSSKPFLLIQSL